MTRRALVVGGSGFIGSNLCNALLESGWDVSSLDLRAPVGRLPGVRYVEADFFGEGPLERECAGADAVFHALGVLNPGNSAERYRFGYSAELVRTTELFDAATASGARVVYVSSGGTVYAPAQTPRREDSPLRPANHYGAMKLAAEAALQAFSSQRGVPCVVARLSNPYGPGQDHRRGVGFIAAAVARTLAGEPVRVYGDGSVVRDYIHISDACAALCALGSYEGPHRVFNVGSGAGESQRDVIRLLGELGLRPEVERLPARPVDAPCSVLDCSLMRGKTGVEPRGLRDGLGSYIEWARRRMDEKEI